MLRLVLYVEWSRVCWLELRGLIWLSLRLLGGIGLVKIIEEMEVDHNDVNIIRILWEIFNNIYMMKYLFIYLYIFFM